MSKKDYDLIIIGAGSGGVAAARRAAKYGASVAIIEKDRVGGTCVLRGCVPKKLLVAGANISNIILNSKNYGFAVENVDFNWKILITNIQSELSRLSKIYSNNLIKDQVDIILGAANIISSNIVEVNSTRYYCKKILIAVGAKPNMPDIPGIKYAITSNEIFNLNSTPRSISIVGSGYIALEFASILSKLGVKVNLVIRKKYPLSNFDIDIQKKILEIFCNSNNISVYTETIVTKITKKNQELLLETQCNKEISSELVLYATGRVPNTKNLFNKNLNIELSKSGKIIVDKNFETSEPGIYAVGDAINNYNLTPVAIREGRAFAERFYNNKVLAMNYTNIPTAIFTIPEIATVGLNEQQSIKFGHNIKIYSASFKALEDNLTNSNHKVFIKMITDKDSDKILGVQMIGKGASEIMQIIAVAIQAGLSKSDFDKTIALHPSIAEEFVLLN